jgi:uncharacterized cupin superfamily protein
MDVSLIIAIEPGMRLPYVPPLTDYKASSPSWAEAEYHCLDLASSRVRVGYWAGNTGTVTLDPWVYTEVCSILSGRVAVVDPAGGRREFKAGDGFIVPKGFVGEWVTIEPSTKIYLAID